LKLTVITAFLPISDFLITNLLLFNFIFIYLLLFLYLYYLLSVVFTLWK